MLRDHFRFRNDLKRIRANQKSGNQNKGTIESLSKRIELSASLRAVRLQKVPAPTIDTELPIFERRDEIKPAERIARQLTGLPAVAPPGRTAPHVTEGQHPDAGAWAAGFSAGSRATNDRVSDR